LFSVAETPETTLSRPLILASGSRYRRDLLARLGLPFEVASRDVDESRLAAEPAATLAKAKAIAERKRKAAARAAARKAWVQSFTLPIAGFQLSARFGERGGWSTGRHTGLDFRAPYGTTVRAVADARVLRTTYHPAYGKMIVLDIGRGITVWYCHLSSIEVSPGEKVDVGERIGAVGMTGNTSGPHLHLEVRHWDRLTDPAVFFWAKTPGYTGPTPSWAIGGRIETLATL